MAETQTQDKVTRRLEALIARANHPNTPKPEADLCRSQIDKLIIKHEIYGSALEALGLCDCCYP